MISRSSRFLSFSLLTLFLPSGCVPPTPLPDPIIPSLRYSKNFDRGQDQSAAPQLENDPDLRARVRLVSDQRQGSTAVGDDPLQGVVRVESSLSNNRPYQGPLAVGDPGVSASLWKESRGSNDFFRDFRAWQPMDLITIVVSEQAEGKKAADTQLKQKSSLSAAIANLFGLETVVKNSGYGKDKAVDPASLVSATTTSDYKGEGETNRKDSLTARISAVVKEVFPTGVIRVEGEKIIAVNGEEQVMVISGLVRPRDINSENEVNSAKIADMRIDYYGRGSVDDSTRDGWGMHLLRKIWPF